MRFHRTPGKPWGKISAKHLEVFEALLWGFHNCKTGLCFPSYEKIAEKVPGGIARSTVAIGHQGARGRRLADLGPPP